MFCTSVSFRHQEKQPSRFSSIGQAVRVSEDVAFGELKQAKTSNYNTMHYKQ